VSVSGCSLEDRSTDVERDREEWRRPWRFEDTPERTVAGVGSSEVTEPSAAAGPGAHAGGAYAGATAAGARAAAEAGAGDGIARHPQPPPAGWHEGRDGPGSPAGSVRPPDTTGTVDAPERAPRGRGLLAIVVAALVGALVATGVTLALTDTGVPGTTGTTAPQIEVEGEEAGVVPAVAQAVTPSVVSIDVLGGQPDAGALPFGGGPRAGLGSGVIYRSDGYILTNHHVVENAETLRVRLSSGDVMDAELVGSDPLNDLAVVRIEAEDLDLPAINVRPEDEAVRVGETVIAIGSPFGLDGSVTTGIVSALNRDIQVGEEDGVALTIPSVLQTDAAINPGNSGGALVDARGRLVGINTAILTGSGANQGVGFAVPAEQAISSAEQLIEQGFVRHPLLGVTGIDVSPEVAEEFGLDASRGAVVDSVQDGSGADEAGLQSGDIIIAVEGEELATMAELVALVRVREPGDTLQLTVVRDGEQMDFDVTLGERPR
jgi:S1-C subfamily serine protease